VRNYVDKIEEVADKSNYIYEAESDGEDLSYLSEYTIILFSNGLMQNYHIEEIRMEMKFYEKRNPIIH